MLSLKDITIEIDSDTYAKNLGEWGSWKIQQVFVETQGRGGEDLFVSPCLKPFSFPFALKFAADLENYAVSHILHPSCLAPLPSPWAQ